MKRVAVITYIKTDNYGAELQGYALQKVLNDYGYDAEDIDIDMIPLQGTVFRTMVQDAIIGRFKNNPITAIPQIFTLIFTVLKKRYRKPSLQEVQYKKSRQESFSEFWNKFIKHSKVHYDPDTLYSTDMDYDYVIAGSDQIWNYTRTSRLDVYFMMWAPKKAKCISYAASVSVKEIPDELKPSYEKYLKNVQCISVRENEGVDTLREFTDKEIRVVLDPTLLLNKNDWMKVASEKYRFDFPYIVAYSLNSSYRYWQIVYAYAKKYDYKIVNLRHDFVRNNDSPNRIDIYDAGPREFIYIWAHASMAITNSFHGTIFSINFNIPFVSVLNKASKTNSRIESVLENFDLLDRLVYDSNPIEIKSNDMNFTNSNRYLEINREESVDYLLSSLEYHA